MPRAAKKHRRAVEQAGREHRPPREQTTAVYDRRWREFREAYLAAHPLCIQCGKNARLTAATEVDHIVPLNDGGAQYDESNCQGLCKSCHSRKTATEDGAFGNRKATHK